MSDGQQRAHFRFEQFADAPSAQAAFEASYPLGSPIETALRALVEMGAQGKAVSPTRAACRYVERGGALAGWCWHVALERNNENGIQRVSMTLSALGT